MMKLKGNWNAGYVMWDYAFSVFQEVPYKGEIQLHDLGGEACIYIKQITTKKGIYIEFYFI
jgi:hypothetical protein